MSGKPKFIPALVLEHLADGPLTTAQLLEHISASKRGMEQAIKKLHDEKKIHIAKFKRKPGWGGKHAAVWKLGPGEDAKIVIKRRATVQRDHNPKRRARYALQAHAGNPFAGMIAQMRAAGANKERT